MPLKELLEREWGVKTDKNVNPLASSVTTSVVQLLTNNPNRLAWSLTNLGAAAIYLAFDPVPSASNGLYVAPTGGNVILLWNEDFELVTYPVYGVAASGTNSIYLIEVFEV